MNLAFRSYRLKNRIMSQIAPTTTAKHALARFIRPRRSTPKQWEQTAETFGTRFQINESVSAIRWLSKSHDQQTKTKKLLLAHGWESRATQMYRLVPTLIKLGYEVIAVDMPGHGHSSGETSHAEAFVQTLLLAQQRIGHFDAVIGHSLGAGASSIALSRGLLTDKLVLISGPSSVDNVLRQFSRFVGLNRRATEEFINHASQLVGVGVNDLDAAKANQSVKTPTLIIHDQEDSIIPISESERLLQTFNNAQFVKTTGLGHRKILKAEYVNRQIIEFLSDT